jgi:hypothetical protein
MPSAPASVVGTHQRLWVLKDLSTTYTTPESRPPTGSSFELLEEVVEAQKPAPMLVSRGMRSGRRADGPLAGGADRLARVERNVA